MTKQAQVNIFAGIYILAALVLHISGIGGKNMHLIAFSIPLAPLIINSLPQNYAKLGFDDFTIRIQRLTDQVPKIAYIWILSGLFLIVWSIKYFHMYAIFDLRTFDAGIYGNIVFNTAKGDLFYSSVLEKNHLGEHFSPIMSFFAPFYWIKPDIRWLLIIQVISYCCIPLIIYRISDSYTNKKSEKLLVSLALSISWFLYVPMRSAMEFTFHPSTLAAPLIMLAFAYIEEKKIKSFAVVMATLILFKENIPLVLMGFGLYLVAHRRELQKGLLLLMLGLSIALILTTIVIPFFGNGAYSKLNRLDIWADLGLKSNYLLGLLLPMGFLPLIFWRRGIISLPAIMQNIIVGFSPMYSSSYHYDDLIAPLMFACMPGILICCVIPLCNKYSLNKTYILVLAFFFSLTFSAKASPLQAVWRNPINNIHNEIKGDLDDLQKRFPKEVIYLQHPLFTHFNRSSTFDLSSCHVNDLSDDSIVVLATETSLRDWPINDLDHCIDTINAHKGTKRINGFKRLKVFSIQH